MFIFIDTCVDIIKDGIERTPDVDWRREVARGWIFQVGDICFMLISGRLLNGRRGRSGYQFAILRKARWNL
jgi:hypothetical protein